MNSTKKNGLIAGGLTILFMMIVYLLIDDKRIVLSYWVYWGSIIFYLFFMSRSCLEKRASHGGNLIFKDALRAAFITFLVANAVFHLFNYVLFNFVDPGLVDIQMEMAKELYPKLLPKEQAKDMLQTMKREGFEMSIPNLIFAYAKGAIGGFVLSLIIAGITRREEF